MRKGFTLVEVLIVVIIIGILASIAVPQYMTSIEKARSGEAAVNIGSVRTSVDRYWYQNASITSNFAYLDVDNPNDITNKLYTYTLTDDGTDASTRAYTITATRTSAGGTVYTVEWVQTNNIAGQLYRSANLGGPVKPD